MDLFTIWLPFAMGTVLFPLGEHIGYEPMCVVGLASIVVACLGVVIA